jgi:hypothetical protein
MKWRHSVANAWDQAEASKLLRASLGISAYTAPTTPIMNRLMSANGSASAAGTQITGGSYAPQNLSTALGTEANGAVANTSAVTHTLMPAATTVGVEWWDSAGTPRRQAWGALASSKTTASGDTLSFAAAALSININS